MTKREQAAVTLPEATRAVADVVKDAGARPIIAESAAVSVDTEEVISESGYQQLREMGYEVIDLRKTGFTTLPVKKGKIFKKIQTYKLVKEVDAIIPIAKLKTHDDAGLTLSIKNLKGLLTDKEKRRFHKYGLFEACVDWLGALRPQLAMVDAIYGQEGLGPVYGKVVEMDLIVAGHDAVSVDSICGYITGFEPDEVPITAEAVKRGVGVARREEIEVVGEPIESVYRRFMRYSEDDLLKVEGFNLLYGNFTCTGCWLAIHGALVDIKEANQSKYLQNITLINFDLEVPEHVPKEGIITVGSCMSREKRSKCHVNGCPPTKQDIIQVIIDHRAKAERHRK